MERVVFYLIIAALVIAFAAFFFTIATPIAILIVYIYCSIKARKISISGDKECSDYWIDAENKYRFVSLNIEADILRSQLNSYNRKKDNIHKFAEENNISKNLDGRYSRRSNLGKEVVSKLDYIEGKIQEITDEIKENSWKLSTIRNSPKDKWLSDFLKLQEKDMYCRYKISSMISFILWIASFGVCYIYFSNMKYQESKIFSYSAIISAAIAAIFYGLLYLFHKNKNKKFSMKSSEPPEVTLDNYNQY